MHAVIRDLPHFLLQPINASRLGYMRPTYQTKQQKRNQGKHKHKHNHKHKHKHKQKHAHTQPQSLPQADTDRGAAFALSWPRSRGSRVPPSTAAREAAKLPSCLAQPFEGRSACSALGSSHTSAGARHFRRVLGWARSTGLSHSKACLAERPGSTSPRCRKDRLCSAVRTSTTSCRGPGRGQAGTSWFRTFAVPCVSRLATRPPLSRNARGRSYLDGLCEAPTPAPSRSFPSALPVSCETTRIFRATATRRRGLGRGPSRTREGSRAPRSCERTRCRPPSSRLSGLRTGPPPTAGTGSNTPDRRSTPTAHAPPLGPFSDPVGSRRWIRCSRPCRDGEQRPATPARPAKSSPGLCGLFGAVSPSSQTAPASHYSFQSLPNDSLQLTRLALRAPRVSRPLRARSPFAP
eukprot:scaffold1070_cov245-Pinguiococcus_pyrenoidosus.AAC.48